MAARAAVVSMALLFETSEPRARRSFAMGVLTVLPAAGSAQQYRWREGDPVSTHQVQRIFENLMKESQYIAYEVRDEGGRFASAFNPGALYIVMQPPVMRARRPAASAV
jgi:hypothetical protein